jgi:tryptophan synthase beta chain
MGVSKRHHHHYPCIIARTMQSKAFRSSRKISLDDRDMPMQWYNIVADLPVKPPLPLNPKTRQVIKPEDLSPIFTDALIEQEGSLEAYIDIPEEVLEVYSTWRPTPLFR